MPLNLVVAFHTRAYPGVNGGNKNTIILKVQKKFGPSIRLHYQKSVLPGESRGPIFLWVETDPGHVHMHREVKKSYLAAL